MFLCLSVCLSLVAVSDSAGQISLCQFNEGSCKLCQILQWTGHQYEAWITAFDAWNSAIVYSGKHMNITKVMVFFTVIIQYSCYTRWR